MDTSRKYGGSPFFRSLRRLLMLSVAVWLLSGSVSYSPAVRARIVAPDGKPVAGAHVLAGWTVEHSFSGTPLRQAGIAEALTDEDGWFEIPAWGPRVILPGSIRIDEPTIRIYKPGFVPMVVKNYEGVPMTTADTVIRFRLQNQAITLQPFQGSLLDYETLLRPLLSSLNTIYDGPGTKFCYWRQTPRFLLALQDLKLQLEAQGAGHSLPSAHHWASSFTEAKCGNAEHFFRDYARGQTR